MLKLKLNKLLYDRHMNANQLSKLTGIRYPTIVDMVENKSKAWSPENLNKIIIALELERVEDLIEYTKESPSE